MSKTKSFVTILIKYPQLYVLDPDVVRKYLTVRIKIYHFINLMTKIKSLKKIKVVKLNHLKHKG